MYKRQLHIFRLFNIFSATDGIDVWRLELDQTGLESHVSYLCHWGSFNQTCTHVCTVHALHAAYCIMYSSMSCPGRIHSTSPRCLPVWQN